MILITFSSTAALPVKSNVHRNWIDSILNYNSLNTQKYRLHDEYTNKLIPID